MSTTDRDGVSNRSDDARIEDTPPRSARRPALDAAEAVVA